MLISYASTDDKGPSVAKQRMIISEHGFEPEKDLEGEDIQDLGLILHKGSGDIIVVAHHKAFIGPRLTAAVLEAVKRAEATVIVAGERTYDPSNEEDFVAFVAMSAKRWGKSSRTRKNKKGPGRPLAHKRPSSETLRVLKMMWWDPYNSKTNPDGYRAGMVFDMASEALGYEVERWHIKEWISDLRQKPDDGLAKIERTK